METEQRYQIESELGALEEEIALLEELSDALPEDTQSAYDERLMEAEEKVERLRDRFISAQDLSPEDWRESKEAFFEDIEMLRADLLTIRQECESSSPAFNDSF